MTFKSGDLVVLKSGGPIMTVDTVNTDIFDDDKVTGVLCAWFVGYKFERVRFDHRAIEPAGLHSNALGNPEARLDEAADDFATALDEVVSAMNIPAEAGDDARKPCDKSGATMAVSKKKRRSRAARKMTGPQLPRLDAA